MAGQCTIARAYLQYAAAGQFSPIESFYGVDNYRIAGIPDKLFPQEAGVMRLLAFLMGSGFAALAWYGGRAAEAILTYSATADIPLANVKDLATLNRPGRYRSEAMVYVDQQIQHLMGTFQSESFSKAVGSKGTIGETNDVKFTKLDEGSAPGRKLLTYEFRGKAVFDKSIFGSDRRATIPVRIPLAPDLIYKQTLNAQGHNPCTDEHYNTEDDFWYFWDADQRGCPLRGDKEKVLRLQGRLDRIDKTVRPTYPEYDRLLGDNRNGRKLDIAVFFGFIDDVRPGAAKPNRRDDAYKAFQMVRDDLKEQGYDVVETRDAFRETQTRQRRDGPNVLHRYQKTWDPPGADTPPVEVRVQLLLADSDINADSRRERPDYTFHNYLIPAFRDADIIIYDGHSGLGANLKLKNLPNFRFRKDKYQIFFFNGCSTYPYYNGSFFEAKQGGARNLEVITTGLPTLSSTSAPNVLAVLKRFLDGRFVTYQTIMRELEDSNSAEGTYLSAVNGDEDNRWAPRR